MWVGSKFLILRQMETLLTTHKLSREFGQKRALQRLNLQLQRGEVVGLLGPNGAGKSTAMRLISGALAPSHGRVTVAGFDMQQQPIEAKRRLGYLPERPPLHPEQRVDEYLYDCARLRGLTPQAAREALGNSKRRCGLESVGRRLIRNLSKGYQQRAGIAQAIIHAPDLIIFDEPTEGLDPAQIREVRELIRELAEQSAVLLSSHILSEVEACADRVTILQQGRAIYQGAIEPAQTPLLRLQLQQNPGNEALTQLPQIASVERLHTDYFRVQLSPKATAPELAAQIVQQGWGLRQLSEERLSLEQIYLEATSGRTSQGASE
ncbi:ATP-binding transport protein natA [endosymbiont of Riftia pachyptila (vent Ph05)]|uniref:ATP-binding transport protein natA n=2 Tax=Gammaproteobacteria TaxID=1236 RepID=G2DBB8_9GAMM|nr:ATP-binding transport protein natA [endosymbiont of Riftia pachyptila (vent Ph05)]